jgi:KDO2-lipid IV(A) lauroyltransferase
MTPTADTPSLLRFWQPRYWPIWIGLALLRVITLLPYAAQCAIGRGLGRLLWLAVAKRRHVVAVNLRLCFPELDEVARRRLVRRHFESLGVMVVDLGMAAWASDRRLQRLTRIEGIEHLRQATADGRGVIILSAHLPGMEITGRVVSRESPQLAGLYRPLRNRLIDEILRRIRLRAAAEVIPKDSMRQLIRSLKRGVSVWYAPDQSYRRNYSVLIPFFGEPAMTNAALTPIAKLSGARVLPYFSERLPDGQGYLGKFLPPLADFPSEDPEADARRVTALIEEQIRRSPEQYYWIHRRFKGRPGLPDPYAR